MVELEVESRQDAGVDMSHRIQIKHRRVEGAYDVEAYPLGILGDDVEMDAFQQMRRKLAAYRQALHHLVQDGTLALSVAAAEDVHLPVQFPDDMFLAAPEGVNLDTLDIVSILLHRLIS